jgi:hypothetical protein
MQVLTELKAKAESMNESKGSDIKDLAKQLRDVVKDARNGVQGSMHLVATKRSEGVLRKISELQVKLQRALDKSSEKVDLSALNAKLEEAKKLNAEAMAAFEAARSAEPGKKDEAMKATTEKVREVQRALKEAHVLLKDVVQKLKSARAGTEVLANVSAS